MSPVATRLPVCGQDVILLAPTGADELAIQDARTSATAIGVMALRRLARTEAGEALDIAALAVTDFEHLLLTLRQAMIGTSLRSDFPCSSCGERVETSFSVADYLARIRVRRPRDVEAHARPGWYRLEDAAFRLPTVADQTLAQSQADGGTLLAERCLDPAQPPKSIRLRIERAMAAMAPELSRTLVGRCPACGQAVRALFHVPSFVLGELRRAATAVMEEIHLIAGAYHWTEDAILALPSPRRRSYAERIRAERLDAASLEF